MVQYCLSQLLCNLLSATSSTARRWGSFAPDLVRLIVRWPLRAPHPLNAFFQLCSGISLRVTGRKTSPGCRIERGKTLFCEGSEGALQLPKVSLTAPITPSHDSEFCMLIRIKCRSNTMRRPGFGYNKRVGGKPTQRLLVFDLNIILCLGASALILPFDLNRKT